MPNAYFWWQGGIGGRKKTPKLAYVIHGWPLVKIICLSLQNELSDVNKTYIDIGNRQKFELVLENKHYDKHASYKQLSKDSTEYTWYTPWRWMYAEKLRN